MSIASASGRGGQERGYLEDVEDSWPETWRTGSSLMSWLMFFHPKDDTMKVSCWYLYWKCVLGGLWGLPDRRHEGLGHSWRHEWCFLTQRKIPWKFCVHIFIGSASGSGGQEGGYLEDIEGSWSETWRTWLFLMSWMMFLYPKEDTRKVLCWYLYWKYVRKGGSKRGDLEDIEGSWQETWRTGSSLMSWMTLFDPKDHILKVSCCYLRVL